MQSLNFNFKPIIGLDETIKYGRYFQNQIRHRFVAENYQDGAFLYSLTDKTNKGLRYFLSVSKERIEHLTAYQSISFIANEGEEISNHLFVNKLIDQNYDRSYSFSPVKTKNFYNRKLRKKKYDFN